MSVQVEEKRLPRIYVHQAPSHMDEIFASAIVLYHNPMINEIRLGLDDDYFVGFDWMVDVGKNYDPEKLQFDHHQEQQEIYDGNGHRKAAVELVGDYIAELDEQFWEWWYNEYTQDMVQTMSLTDNMGRKTLADSLSVTMRDLSAITPSFGPFMHLWDSDPYGVARNMSNWICEQVEELADVNHLLGEWKNRHTRINNDILFIDGWPEWVTRSIANAVVRKMVECLNHIPIRLVVSHTTKDDERNPGKLSMFRTGYGSDKYDLTKIEYQERVTYVHHNGFLAIVDPHVPVLELARLAVKPGWTGE